MSDLFAIGGHLEMLPVSLPCSFFIIFHHFSSFFIIFTCHVPGFSCVILCHLVSNLNSEVPVQCGLETKETIHARLR